MRWGSFARFRHGSATGSSRGCSAVVPAGFSAPRQMFQWTSTHSGPNGGGRHDQPRDHSQSRCSRGHRPGCCCSRASAGEGVGVVGMNLPEYTTPDELAIHLGWSARKLKATARALGACRVLGNRMVLTRSDVEIILEATKPCPSSSSSAGKSGTTPARLPGGDYEALLRLRRSQKPSGSPTRSKAKNSKVVAKNVPDRLARHRQTVRGTVLRMFMAGACERQDRRVKDGRG